MSRKLFLSIALALLLPFYFVAAQAADTRTVVLEVPGMTCNFCPITIRKALEKVPGVIDAKADYGTKTATVVFDPDETDVAELTTATANAGYPSTVR